MPVTGAFLGNSCWQSLRRIYRGKALRKKIAGAVRLTWPTKTGSKTGLEGQQHHFLGRGEAIFGKHPHLVVGFERD
ncbi:hypothetical protein [Mesorhizobium sp. Root102]|uniref:hypothetical protein n=1 Tax=Mesorhizobium sp. Root102 TaxID=1736422 RepID=UPI0012E371EA|nr:hypothetical protein [Mesorhizobium sp. Root102]